MPCHLASVEIMTTVQFQLRCFQATVVLNAKCTVICYSVVK